MALMNPYNYSKPRNVSVTKPLGMQEANTVKPSEEENNKQKTVKNAYLEQRIMSAKPEELTYMLYDGLVKFIKKSIMFCEDKKYDKVNYNSLRAQAIIDELRMTLDMNIEVAQGFDDLYEFAMHSMVQGNIKKEVSHFKAALKVAEGFRDSWKEAFKIKD